MSIPNENSRDVNRPFVPSPPPATRRIIKRSLCWSPFCFLISRIPFLRHTLGRMDGTRRRMAMSNSSNTSIVVGPVLRQRQRRLDWANEENEKSFYISVPFNCPSVRPAIPSLQRTMPVLLLFWSRNGWGRSRRDACPTNRLPIRKLYPLIWAE